jgi:RNA polymerase sigma-70 factor (ECF subfamily)
MDEQTRRDELFQRVLAEYGAGLWRLTAGYASHREDREDLYQDILVALLTALGRFRGDSSLRTYVYRIGHNVGISHRRLRTRQPVSMPPDELASPAPSPESEVIADARRARLLEVIRALPHGQRQTMMLHLEGFGHAEIADVLGTTPNNVGVRLHRARKEIRSRLGLDVEAGAE